uniref:Uncharacterized protein n=1 Tax=viral metagenome TaxID=1070528 RepID=A0A6M3KBW9_9ZZZZ
MENIEMLQQELELKQKEETKLVNEIKNSELSLLNSNKSLKEYQNIQNKINNVTLANQRSKEILKSIKSKIENIDNLIGTDTLESLNEKLKTLHAEADTIKIKIDEANYEFTVKAQEQRKIHEIKRKIEEQEKRNSSLKEKLDSLKVNKQG